MPLDIDVPIVAGVNVVLAAYSFTKETWLEQYFSAMKNCSVDGDDVPSGSSLAVLVVRSGRTDVSELGMFACARKLTVRAKIIAHSILSSSINDTSMNNLPLSYLT